MTPVAAKKNRGFDPHTFLATIGEGRNLLAVPKGQSIYAQGDQADAVFYVQEGKVRLTVVSKAGKEATIGILNERSFLAKARLPARLFGWDPRPP
jgi:CRP-like cAMP-binding protein